MAYYAVTYSNELYHHGIKGQKWGVRRYRNRDGTLTELGKRRIGGGKKENKVRYDKKTGRILDEDSVANAERKIDAQIEQDYRSLGTASSSGANIARTISSMINRFNQSKQQKAREEAKAEIDVSKISDKELRDAINRMSMEKQYKDLKTTDVSTGRATASDVLSVVGDVLAIGSSAASIAYFIYQMNH